MSGARPPDGGLDVAGPNTQKSSSPPPLRLVPESPRSPAIPPQTRPFAFSTSVAVSFGSEVSPNLDTSAPISHPFPLSLLLLLTLALPGSASLISCTADL